MTNIEMGRKEGSPLLSHRDSQEWKYSSSFLPCEYQTATWQTVAREIAL